jgi:RimJ/RimL family protein N-acetyltransferase
VENIAEQRALEAAGFQREGVTRGAQWRDGAYHDGILYAVLRADPARRLGGFATWPATEGPAASR